NVYSCCSLHSPDHHRNPHSFPTRRSSDLDGTGKISDMSLSEIKRLRTPQGQQILTLDEVLRHYGTSIKYYIETKRPQSQAMDDELVRLLVKHNLIGIDRVKEQVIILSFSKESLHNIHEQYSDILLVSLLI